MILEGKLIKAKREVKDFDGRKTDEKLFLTLAEVELDDTKMAELKEVFKDSGKKFTPDWILKFEGYVNLATKFELPARLLDGTEVDSVEAAIKEGYKWMSAPCKISINLKDGALYPNAIVFTGEGKGINPFAEFDE